MPNAGYTKEDAEERLKTIEKFLEKGHPPRGVVPPRGEYGATRMACEAYGLSAGNASSFLIAAERGAGREVDWSLWKRPAVPAVSAGDGYKVRAVSTYVDGAGKVKGQWVKTDEDKARQLEIFKETVAGFKSQIPQTPKIKKPKGTNKDLLYFIPVGDAHIGMYSWAEETGADWDTDIAEKLLIGASEYLIDAAPACDTCVIALMGDFFHYDSMEAVTPTHKNVLDADTRFPQMVRTGIRVARYMIDRALQKFGKVRVIVEIGNHDLTGSIFLAEMLSQFYEKEPRLTVDTSPAHFHYFQFGKVLLATHHGHGRAAKFNDLPEIMATDCEGIWSETRYRYWFTGHVHHKSAEDKRTCSIESLRVLPPADAHAANNGYRLRRDMQGIVFDRETGEMGRTMFNPAMLAGGV